MTPPPFHLGPTPARAPANPVPGRFELRVADDALSVLLRVVAPRDGGEAVTAARVLRELRNIGVVLEAMRDVIDRTVAEASGQWTVVVSGRPPEHGTQTRFEALVDALTSQAGDSAAAANHRWTLGRDTLARSLPLVQPGTAVMRRHPGRAGTPGLDVYGKPLFARSGRDEPFDSGLTGVAPARDDADLLLATVAGHPSLRAQGVCIYPGIVLLAADLRPGRVVEFAGSIVVYSDLLRGMRVRAGGDIVVHGLAEDAALQAGGNICVYGGIMGRHVGESGRTEHDAGIRISAGGSVRAFFVENADVSAGEDIDIHEFVLRSRMHAGRCIRVGVPDKPKGRYGRVLSSDLRAVLGMQVQSVGTSGRQSVQLEVGHDSGVQEAWRRAVAELRAAEMERGELIANQAFVRVHSGWGGPNRLQQIEQQLQDVERRIASLRQTVRDRETALEACETAEIRIGQVIHIGAVVVFGQTALPLTSEYPAGRFVMRNGAIVFEPDDAGVTRLAR